MDQITMAPAACALLAALLVALPQPVLAQTGPRTPESVLAKANAVLEQATNDLGMRGQPDRGSLAATGQDVSAALALSPPPGMRAELLLAQANLARIATRCAAAEPMFEKAANEAAAAARHDLLFDAEIGVARCESEMRQHDAVWAAIDRAEAAAGDTPNADQSARLAYWRAEELDARGDAEAALPWAARAIRSSVTTLDRFKAYAKAADVFHTMVEQCVLTPALDRCPKIARAEAHLRQQAAEIAKQQGWSFAEIAMQTDAQSSAKLADLRAQAAKDFKLPPQMAAPLSARDVLVNREFGPMPGSLSQEQMAEAEKSFFGLTGSAKPDQAHTAFEAALSQQLALIGEGFSSYAFVAAETELAKGNVTGGLAHFLRAVELVEQERGSFFDLRKRGTAAAAKNDVYERPALLLLRLNQDAEAFRLFELARARGLAELSNIGKDASISQDDLSAIATLLQIEAQLSDTTRQFADHAVTAEDVPLNDPKLTQLANDEARQRGLAEQMQPLLARLAARPKPALATRDDLLSAAARANLPVLLYWTTDVAVIGWYVGPQGSKPLNIFLPLGVLREKVAAVRASSNKQGVDFDQTAARELYLFLIQPFADLLTSPGVLIVPQGPLADLPFEALVDPTSGRFLAERYSISYAPNATLALRALQQPARLPTRLLAVSDPKLAAQSGEIDEVSAALGADHVQTLGTFGLRRSALATGLAGADAVHVLAHGFFQDEPLLSTVDLPSANERSTAAQLVGLPVRGLSLAVFSACESGRVAGTLSNEIFGIPWALLVDGVDTVVLSRWKVLATSNATWMGHFYQALAAGNTPAQAAAAAMRAMLASPETAHPYHWAGMQVIGG
jgi:CHAT domain-containing protein